MEQAYEYLVVLEAAEEGGFNVSVPDLDLFTSGDTREQALAMAAEAVKGAVDTLRSKGWPVPPPTAVAATVRVSA